MSDMIEDDTPKQDLDKQQIPEDFANEAMAEDSSFDQDSQASGLSIDDDWAAALAEQTAAEQLPEEQPESHADNQAATNGTSDQPPAEQVFQPLFNKGGADNGEIDMVMDIPVQLSVELGRTRLTIKNILQLGQGSVVELDGLAGEPMDICVNGYLIAQGEVVVVDDKYGIRVTDIITPADRIARLNNKR